MFKISQQTADEVNRRHLGARVADVMAEALPKTKIDRDAVIQTVVAVAAQGEAAGFASEADLGLYCIACHLDPAGMSEDGALGVAARNGGEPLPERRFALKTALDRAGVLPFGAHEAVPPETTAP